MIIGLATLGNAVCGFAAIAYASKVRLDGSVPEESVNYYFMLSAVLILIGMIFDVLDGYAARLSRSASDFGAELDSLCDAVTFGAAPAFLLLRLVGCRDGFSVRFGVDRPFFLGGGATQFPLDIGQQLK